MTWTVPYHAPNMDTWHGRPDTPLNACVFQHIKLLNLAESVVKPNLPAFALLGFCCDEGIRRNHGRVGAASGPIAIREYLAKLPFKREHILCYDAGNIVCHDGDLETAQSALGAAVTILLDHHITPILLGGGHEIAWGHYQGIAKAKRQQPLSIINFDAHYDMRPLLNNQLGSSGTPFLQIAQAQQEANKVFDYHVIGIQDTGNTTALTQTASHWHTTAYSADAMHLEPLTAAHAYVQHVLQKASAIYVSICLDVFANAYAPGVSAPQVLGLTPWQVLPLLKQIATSGKVMSYDLAELSPPLDNDFSTTRLAATLCHRIIHQHQF